MLSCPYFCLRLCPVFNIELTPFFCPTLFLSPLRLIFLFLLPTSRFHLADNFFHVDSGLRGIYYSHIYALIFLFWISHGVGGQGGEGGGWSPRPQSLSLSHTPQTPYKLAEPGTEGSGVRAGITLPPPDEGGVANHPSTVPDSWLS